VVRRRARGVHHGRAAARVDDDYTGVDVEATRADGASIWHRHRRFVEPRHGGDVLAYGEHDLLCPEDE